MLCNDIDKEIEDLIKNSDIYPWEDISESFCLLRYAAINNKNIILLFDKTATESELSYAMRYIGSFGVKIKLIINIYFNINKEIIIADDVKTVIKELEDKGNIILKYRSIKNMALDDSYKSQINFLNTLAISLTLPNYRERCEDMYLYYSRDIEKLFEIGRMLGDEISQKTFLELIKVFTTNGIYTLTEYTSKTKYFDCYKHLENEIWVNCGSCNGDTIFNFLAQNYSYSKIFAVEGIERFYTALTKNISRLPEKDQKKIRLLNYFVGGAEDDKSFDRLFEHTPVTLINMDIEGYELSVLRGAKNIIKKYRPALAIAAYHVKSDLYEIPSYVTGIVDNYSLFLRKYCGYEGNSFNEFIYYCVPNERVS